MKNLTKLILFLNFSIIVVGQTSSQLNKIAFPKADADNYYVFNINNIYLPIDNKGILADVYIPLADTNYHGPNGQYDGNKFIFGGGFFLSGYADGELWGNGVMSPSRTEDYLSGKVGSNPEDSLNKIYVVSKFDKPFGESWQKWKDAVSLGADFYDGNKDNKYEPIDLNENNHWDENEDKPDILGDVSAWSVYNDNVSDSLRRYKESSKGIEIYQTVFALQENHALGNTIFIRYRIKNTGSVIDCLDDVYFSIATDPDLGYAHDDLVGSDIQRNAGYCYNREPDDYYGVDCPSFFATLLHGPISYIPNVTFWDNNNNGSYDDNIDTPIDTALVLNEKHIGNKKIVGAKILNITSATQYIKSHPIQGDPDNIYELRNYILGGKYKNGDSLFVSSWPYGNGVDLDLDTLNTPSNFMYSGNPEMKTGWLNTDLRDQRLMINTGPFKLNVGESQDIYAAYVVGRGETSLNSVTVTKEILDTVRNYFANNYTRLIVGVTNSNKKIATEFELNQNYPNPFNPSTTIKYQIPKDGMVSLRIYDIIGQEVKTIVNETQTKGRYEINFDASNLSSGVYFYRLTSGSFTKSRQMLLLK